MSLNQPRDLLITLLIISVLTLKSINCFAGLPAPFCFKLADKDTLELRIDPRTALNDSTSASEILQTAEYIALQTPSNLYVSRIDQLEVTDDFFFVLDKSNKVINSRTRSAIFIFNKNGAFHAVISVTKCSYFALNRQLKQIVFRDDNSHSEWLIYDYQGNQVRKEPRLLEFNTFDFLDKNTIAYYKNYTYLKRTGNVLDSSPALSSFNLVIAKNGKATEKYLPFDTTNIVESTGVLKAGKYFYRSDKLYIIPGYEYNCYEVDEKNILNMMLKFVFPHQFTLPADFISQTVGKKTEYFENHNNLIYSISDFYHIGSFYIFQLNFSQSLPQVFFYDTEAKILTAWSMVDSDRASFYLPLGETILAGEGQYFYSAITESNLIRNINERKGDKGSVFPESVKSYMSGKSMFVKNPLLVKYQIKG